ncbi:TonB-dependent receptor [Thalassotalea sp. PLHSN55]|uniref:TonB-dependent receptor n=1 Tax=Thalassotalea sp. PLHSN55 TaxID=3435888 RepID=UPI003F83F422
MQENVRKQFALTTLSKACVMAIGVSAMPALAEDDAKAAIKKAQEEQIEVITVSGVRGSIQKSMNDKRFSTEIMDGISAEDIGQLPDENIAEALQRVTGIQMTRDADGEGSTIQIRGISSNNVEINGQTASGTGSERTVNFQDLPSELFSGIEVLKATTADRIEGALGGTINLKTRRPLNIQKDQIFSVTAKGKHSDLAEKSSPDFSVFGGKNWRDTAIGDFGFVATVAHKESFKRTEAFGGADSGSWAEATGNWRRIDQHEEAKTPFDGTIYDTHRMDTAPIDVNKDGVIDSNDSYYMSNGFTANVRDTEDIRDSFNATLQWQPNDITNFFLDTTITNAKAETFGSSFGTQFNHAMPTMGYAQNFSSIGTSGDGVERYVYDAGTISGANIRMGGGPSHKLTYSKSKKFTLGGDVQVTDELNIAAEYSYSEGSSYTKQGSLNMGYDYDQSGKFDKNDFAGIATFDLRGSDLGTYTLYNAPYGNGPLTEAGDITGIDQQYLNFHQLQRNGNDVDQDEQSFKVDAVLELDGDFFTQVKTGVRFAERNYGRVSYENKNTGGTTKYTYKDENGNNVPYLDADGNELYKNVPIQGISVSPEGNGDKFFGSTGYTEAELAYKLQTDCFAPESAAFDNFSGDVPQEWTTINCSMDYHTDLFNLVALRAMGENNVPVYEILAERFDVTEQTYASYARADFYGEVFGDMNLFGNFGGRFIKTKTKSSGYVPSDAGLVWGEFENEYNNFLPSLNVNLGLNSDMVLRFAAAKVMSRPGLSSLSPSLELLSNDDLPEGYAGVAQGGDPYLEPVLATNVDLSFEWYYSKSSMFSAAVFYKDIESTITLDIEKAGDVWVGDSKYKHYVLVNGAGTKLKGAEFSLTHTFDELPSLLSYTGFSTNYTYTTEPSQELDQEGDPMGRKGLSENSANLVLFYDDKTLNVRLAYNWRSEFFKRHITPLGWAETNSLPEIEAARGQLDLSANYTLNKNLKVNFSIVNLNDSVTERYLKYEELTNYLSESGRRYNLGIVYRF